jgi:Protein of unknown function (DUF1552)
MSERVPRTSAARRSFLRAIGAGFVCSPLLPFLRALEHSVAHAAGETPPQRFVTMYHPHGIAAETWVMRGADTEDNFDLTFTEPMSGAVCPLQPLDRHKSRLLVIEGIDLLSNAFGHDSAGTILTGSRINSSLQRTGNSSLDQFLAVENGLGKSTRVTSIELAVGTDNAVPGETLSYGAGGVPLPKIIDPVQAFDRLFGGLVQSDDPATREAALRQQRLGKTLVDFLNADARRLKARLAPTEQRKLDQHMTALADREKRLAPIDGAGMLASCPSGLSPMRPASSQFPKLKRYFGGEPYFDAISDAHIDLIALAFACDVTRFATLLLGDLSYEGNPLDLPPDNHGGIAHTYDGSPVGSNGNLVGSGTPSTWALLAKFNRYAYGKVARMMDKLTDYGVVDSTLVYASSEMGNPALHSTRNVPTVLAGGLNGKFRMGRRLKVATDCPSSNLACKPGDAAFNGIANNHLLVSIAQVFGVAIDSFGTQPNSADKNGPLAGLT